MVLNTYEARILTILIKSNRWMTMGELSRLSGLSWNTINKYLIPMYKKGWLDKNGNYWKALLPRI